MNPPTTLYIALLNEKGKQLPYCPRQPIFIPGPIESNLLFQFSMPGYIAAFALFTEMEGGTLIYSRAWPPIYVSKNVTLSLVGSFIPFTQLQLQGFPASDLLLA